MGLRIYRRREGDVVCVWLFVHPNAIVIGLDLYDM